MKHVLTVVYNFETKEEKENFYSSLAPRFGKDVLSFADYDVISKKDKYEEALREIVDQGHELDHDEKLEELEASLLEAEIEAEGSENADEVSRIEEELENYPEWVDPVEIASEALGY